ncbi:hypothetical protein [Salibacterium lacus]|uniref:Uncharacterized protein n=1 Tax=Salibacterium lacus TaxID=1898109 RepID=A0ABW5T4A6_9BACI
MNKQVVFQIMYWIAFIIGSGSWYYTFTMDYGIVYTIIITFFTGIWAVLIAAAALKNKLLLVLSVLMFLSPYLMFAFTILFLN